MKLLYRIALPYRPVVPSPIATTPGSRFTLLLSLHRHLGHVTAYAAKCVSQNLRGPGTRLIESGVMLIY